MAADPTNLRILIVEDHLLLREVLEDTLAAVGHWVTGIACAEELCECTSHGLFDVAVVDLNLPGEDGLELARRMRAAAPEMGIVMLTARKELRDKLNGYDAGADIYLTKPVPPQELLACVAALGRRVLPAHSAEPLCLDCAAMKLAGPAGAVALTRSETLVLRQLALAREQSLEYWQVLEILGLEAECDKKRIEVLVSRLRGKLHAAGVEGEAIKAMRNHGYRLLVGMVLR